MLAGLVLSQLVREGAPFIAIGWAGESHDMRHLRDLFAQPDHRGIYASLLHWYGLPMWTLGGITEAKLPDQQAAAEAALTIMADAVAGGHMIHDIGFMESSFTGSLTQLALCDDVIGWVKSFLAPVEITDEELALDAIDEVGPGGTYLLHKHTRRHARERWQPRVFDRASWGHVGEGRRQDGRHARRQGRDGARRRGRGRDPRRAGRQPPAARRRRRRPRRGRGGGAAGGQRRLTPLDHHGPQPGSTVVARCATSPLQPP